jgi:hypothetical protein
MPCSLRKFHVPKVPAADSHHIIPQAWQHFHTPGKLWDLRTVEVCPNCHRRVHEAIVKMMRRAHMRHHANVTVRHNVACQSSRNGAEPVLIVLHDTEGGNIPKSSRDLVGLGDYFDRLSTQASSHVAWTRTATTPGSCRMTGRRGRRRLQLAGPVDRADRVRVGQLEPSKKEDQLHETARWIAWWSKEHGIPIRKGAVTSDGRITRSGVVQHRDLGNLGGGHVDCGPDYPLTQVLAYARYHRKGM